MLPHNSTTKTYTPGAADVLARARDAYEAALAPPLEILAKTFGLIRVARTMVVADSVAYVYERHHTPFGDRCLAWRVTEHPEPQPTPWHDPAIGAPPPNFPPGAPDLKAVVEKSVEVDCNDKRMQAVAPGSLTSPVPRHP